VDEKFFTFGLRFSALDESNKARFFSELFYYELYKGLKLSKFVLLSPYVLVLVSSAFSPKLIISFWESFLLKWKSLRTGELRVFTKGGGLFSKLPGFVFLSWKTRRGSLDILSPLEKVDRSEISSYWLRLSLLSSIAALEGPLNEPMDEFDPNWLSKPPRLELPLLRVKRGRFAFESCLFLCCLIKMFL